jgi:hypothetical protein
MTAHFKAVTQLTGMLQPVLLFAALAAIIAARILLDEDHTQKMHLSSSIQLCSATALHH